jgi:hypothetical protein
MTRESGHQFLATFNPLAFRHELGRGKKMTQFIWEGKKGGKKGQREGGRKGGREEGRMDGWTGGKV